MQSRASDGDQKRWMVRRRHGLCVTVRTDAPIPICVQRTTWLTMKRMMVKMVVAPTRAGRTGLHRSDARWRMKPLVLLCAVARCHVRVVHSFAKVQAATAITVAARRAAQKACRRPLAFVNRYAEALDVLVPNLYNHESLLEDDDLKFKTPFASQPPGTGKTALGRNITAILRRPREADADAEAVIAARLRTAWCWNPAAVDDALRDPRDENLVMRTLLAMYPDHEATLLKLKHVKPLVVKMKDLTPPPGQSFDNALAFGIFCAARGVSQHNEELPASFLAQSTPHKSSTGTVNAIMKANGGAPVMLVLDDITDLQEEMFKDYFRDYFKSPLHNAMKGLWLSLQRLHGVPGCFVFCTGRSLWLSSLALVGSSSPLLLHPTLLQPLSASDLQESIRITADAAGRTLADSLGVAPDLVQYFTEQVVQVTGGVGRAVQVVVRQRQEDVLGMARMLTTHDEVRTAVDSLRSCVPDVKGMLLRVQWDGPKQEEVNKDIPEWAQQRAEQVRLVQLFARMLLLDAPFAHDYTIEIGGEQLRLSDAAVVLGFSYSSVAIAPQPASGEVTSTWGQVKYLRLIAGSWLCRSLLTDTSITSRPAVLATAQLLATMRSFGGTMRGRTFEMLCADALCHRALLSPGATLEQLLPHLSCSARASETVPRVHRSARAFDSVPGLRVVALPKAIRVGLARLDPVTKTALLSSRDFWTGAPTIHSDDLPWLLSTWLPVGSLGVPADAQSGSQDFFLRLSGGVIGFALKAATASAGTAWSDIQDELSKAPSLPPDTPYSLVLWSTYLARKVQRALGDDDSVVFNEGAWYLRGGKLVQEEATGKPKFTVPGSVVELIIANPHAPHGGGLQELLGSSVMEALQTMNDETGSMRIVHLTRWMTTTLEQEAAS